MEFMIEHRTAAGIFMFAEIITARNLDHACEIASRRVRSGIFSARRY